MEGSIEVTRSRRVFTYEGLSPRAQARAREVAREWLSRDIDYIDMTERMRDNAATIFGADTLPDTVTVDYSLSYSQGDGARITGRIDRGDAPSLPWPVNVSHVTVRAFTSHYCHENTIELSFCTTDNDGFEDDRVTLTPSDSWVNPDPSSEWPVFLDECRTFDTAYRQACRELARMGYADIDALSDDGAVAAYLTEHADPYRWNQNGTLAPVEWWADGARQAVTA